MAHTIEVAKSGRAACRTCKSPIAKGELRLGVEVANSFSADGGMSYLWHHLPCAAEKKPAELKAALAAFAGEVPNRAELEAKLATAKPGKPSQVPYAELAPTGRSKCLGCEQPIEKGVLRVAVEREVDTGSFQAKSTGYLHPRCAPALVADPELLTKIKANSTTLRPEDVDVLAKELAPKP